MYKIISNNYCKLMLVCVGSTTSNIDALCDFIILNMDSIICIGLNRERTISGTVQFSLNVFIGDEMNLTFKSIILSLLKMYNK